MALSAAERQRRAYARRAGGRGCITLELDLVALAACMVDEGLIRSDQEDDRAAIGAALEKVIRGLVILTREGVRLRDWL
jgi:hypothetical protein